MVEWIIAILFFTTIFQWLAWLLNLFFMFCDDGLDIYDSKVTFWCYLIPGFFWPHAVYCLWDEFGYLIDNFKDNYRNL